MAALEDKMLQFFELCINNTEGALPDAAMAFYTAAINAVASQTNVSNIQFDTTPASVEQTPGNTFWDAQDRALAYITGLGNTIQIGQEMFGVGFNKTGETALAGRVVYANGTQGIRPTFDYADARDGAKCSWVGVVSADTLNNEEGPVTTFGVLHDMDTSAWAPGTKLYVHSTDSGILTDTPPAYPNFRIWVGTVLVQHITQGTMFVAPRIDHADGITFHDFFSITGVTVNNKGKMTDEGGYAVRLTNKTGAASVKGTLVSGHTTIDDAVILSPASSKACFGIMLEDGIADGQLCWVVVSGIATILLKDATATASGNWVVVSDVAGRANATAISPPGGELIDAAYHFGEIGHSVQTVTAGTNKTARMIIHFN